MMCTYTGQVAEEELGGICTSGIYIGINRIPLKISQHYKFRIALTFTM